MLKQLIQRLLDSRTTPAQAGHASKPGSAVPVDYNPSASVDNWGPVLSNSTAVSDGYIWATGRTTSDKGFFQINTQALQITTTGTSNPGGEILNLFTPVSKGQLFSVYGRYLEQITVRLVKTIGGGYNNFIRRALSCLRPSFNFLPKNSLLAEATGFLTNPIQLFKRRISHLQRQENGFLSSLLATGGSASKGLPRKFCLATGRFGRGAIQQRHLIKAFVSLSQKAGLWLTYYRQTPRAHTSSLLRVLVINNLQTGGALC
jgi:hypothetical protein